MDLQAILVSLKLATCTCLFVLPIAIALSLWLTFSRSRFTILAEALVAMPLVLPPTVVGFYLLYAFSPHTSPLGRLLHQTLGTSLPFTFTGILVGSIIYSLPLAVQPITASFRNINPEMIDAATNLGARKPRVLTRVILPASLPGLIAALVLTFAHALGEFGIVLMIGGSRPGETRSASISIYDSVQSTNYASAAATSLLLIATAATAVIITITLRRRSNTPRATDRR